MKKTILYRILVIFILILMIGIGKAYGTIGTNINKRILRTVGLADGMSKEQKEQTVNDILKMLQDEFEYDGETVNEEMKMLTQISIEKKSQTILSHLPGLEDKFTYTIRIRNRR